MVSLDFFECVSFSANGKLLFFLFSFLSEQSYFRHAENERAFVVCDFGQIYTAVLDSPLVSVVILFRLNKGIGC